MRTKKIKIARIVTIPFVFTHIFNLLDRLNNDERFEVHIISSNGDLLDKLKTNYGNITFHILEIRREISIFRDIIALIRLYSLFKREKFNIVHSHTPKAGLLTALASFLVRVPVRIHTFTGQVWATKKGITKSILKFLDKTIIFLNTRCYTDSLSQKEFLINEGVASEYEIFVLGKGSFGGVDTGRFNKHKLIDKIDKLKEDLFPNLQGKILIYLGRMNPDKGLIELNKAFLKLKKKFEVKLLLVGPKDLNQDQEFENFFNELLNDKAVKYIPFTNTPEIYLGLADIFCFPSYREGFGTVALEAACMELPVIASDIYGLCDAVANEETGLLFNLRDHEDLFSKIEILLLNNDLRADMGKRGRKRAEKFFDQNILTNLMLDEYLKQVKN